MAGRRLHRGVLRGPLCAAVLSSCNFFKSSTPTQIELHALRKKITIIPQNLMMFSTSVRHNLDPFDEHGEERLWAVLEDVQLLDFFEELSRPSKKIWPCDNFWKPAIARKTVVFPQPLGPSKHA